MKNSFYLAWSFHFLPHWIFICIKSKIHLNSHIIPSIYRTINLITLKANWSTSVFLFSPSPCIWRKKPTIFSVLYFLHWSKATLLPDCSSFTQFTGTINNSCQSGLYTFCNCKAMYGLRATLEPSNYALGG